MHQDREVNKAVLLTNSKLNSLSAPSFSKKQRHMFLFRLFQLTTYQLIRRLLEKEAEGGLSP